MTFVGGNDSASYAAVRDMIWNDGDLRQLYEALRMRGASADDAIAEIARQRHRLSQVDDLPSVENYAPSLDSSSLPLNKSARAPTLSRGRTLFAVLTLVAILTAGHTLGVFGDVEKLYSSLSKVASAALSNRANEEVHSIDNSAVAAKAGSAFERDLAHNLNRQDFADRTAAQTSNVRHSASGLEETERAWKVEHHNEQKRSDEVALELASIRTELADRVKAEAAARQELADSAKRLEANEKEWAAKLTAEQERSNSVARDLAAVRTELVDRVKAEAAARQELADSAKRLEANEKEWAAKLTAEQERSNSVARDLAAVRTELVDRVKTAAAARQELAASAKRLEANEKECGKQPQNKSGPTAWLEIWLRSARSLSIALRQKLQHAKSLQLLQSA